MIVQTQYGALRGCLEDGLAVFRGIPYAKPPVGELRWKEPCAIAPWDGVRDALEFGNASVQAAQSLGGAKLIEEPISEDCLYLNIWTLKDAITKCEHRPVLVVIHGGGFQAFSGAYDILQGKELAQRGLVVVTINYRLGAMGFFAHPELSAESDHHTSGNYGILDQIAALRWVKENISVFGGDPESITVSGESAGAFSVSVLCMSPLTGKLFHQATAQSGAFFDQKTAMYKLRSYTEAESICQAATNHLPLAQLRAMSAEEMMTMTAPIASQSFQPVIDNYVFPEDPRALFKKGQFRDIPLLIGSNCDDGSQFASRSGERSEMESLGKMLVGEENLEEFQKVYPCDTREQTIRSQIRLVSDSVFGHNMYVWATLQNRYGHAPVFLYDYRRVPPGSTLGAHHSSELLYFNRKLRYRNKAWAELDYQLQDIYSSYLVNFVKTGNPNGRNLPAWESFANDVSQIMTLDEAPHMAKHPYLDAMALWDRMGKEKN